jgi:serine/threonine protein kinase/Tfp pilus assembly protein PilF
MIGKTISHYRILGVLGEGGMGTIYRAEDEKLRRQVALKFLKPRRDDGTGTGRLVDEARAASKVDHPNICTIYEIDEVEGVAFIAMACVEGRDLRSKIASGPMDVVEAMDVATQMAEGLREAHEHGITHRDVKPANVMLTDKGVVKITDFGLAELFEPASPTGRDTTSGTVAYMSPERLRSEASDRRADVWGLGVVLYEMLAGRRPFQDDYEQATVYSILNLDPTPLPRIRDDVPEALSRIVSKCLEKAPRDRYQSMDELLADLSKVSGATTAPGGARRPIAVISFENLTGDGSYDYLQRAIPNLLITSLERSEQLRVMTWERMQDLLRQLGREDVALVDRKLGFELSELDGVDTIVVGSFTKAGDVFATDAKVLDVESKRLLTSAGAKGEGVGSILMTQVDELSRGILAALRMSDRDAAEIDRPVTEVTTDSLEAYESFLKGRDAYERLYNSDARRHLEAAVKLDPDFAAAHLYLGWTYARLRQAAARDQALEKAKSLSSRATRKERLYIEAAYARTVSHDPEKELRLIKQIARDYPGEKRAHHRLAGYHRAQGRLYQAIEEYNIVLALDPAYGWALNELGYMYTDVADYDRAAEYFERYAEVSPGDANPVDSMGELCFRMGRLDEAIEKYMEALDLKPDFYYAYWEIAYVSALKSDYAEAMRWIGMFIDRAPSFGTVIEGHRWRCFYRYWLGRYEEALSEAELISELAGEEGNLLWITEADRLRAWVHYDRGDLKKSRAFFQSCLEAVGRKPGEFVPAPSSYSPGSLEQVRAIEAAYRFALGMIDTRDGDTGRALSEAADIEVLVPAYAAMLNGEALLAAGETERAIAACVNAPGWKTPYMSDIEGMFAYNVPSLKDTLARAYAEAGETYKAIDEYERLVRVDTASQDRRLAHPLYHYRLAELYDSKGWQDRAADQYRLFLDFFGGAASYSTEVKRARARIEPTPPTTATSPDPDHL